MLKITLSARGTKRLQFFAGLWLWLEAMLAWCGPAFALTLIYANLAVWGLLSVLPPLLQIAVTVLFWIAIIFLLCREFPRVLWPNLARVKSRLERAGALAHQPLQTLSDQPMRRSTVSDVLWQHHQFTAAHELAFLRWPKLRANYATRDPMALRFLLLLLLLLGGLQHTETYAPRLRAAFMPNDLGALAQLGPNEFHLYIMPPDYTGLAPSYYNSDTKPPQKISIPAGSKIWLRVAGGDIKPRLDTGDHIHKLARAQEHYFTIEQMIESGTQLKLSQGIFPLFNVDLDVTETRAPKIIMPEVQLLQRGQMQIKVCAEDQYQLRNITLYWQSTANEKLANSVTIPATGKQFCRTEIINVAADVLAGHEALLWASVENAAYLRSESAKQKLQLPSYEFTNPWAAKLAAARQEFLWDTNAQTELLDVIAELRSTQLPVGLYLALQNAARDLDAGRRMGAASDLWQIIMRIEEGVYADIAANWRAQRDVLLNELTDWQISEDRLQQQLSSAEEAWRAYTPSWGFDNTAFDALWDYIGAQINSGNRSAARDMIRQFDSNPGGLLNQTKWQAPDADAAEILRGIRARLQEPGLTNEEREYLESLLQF